MAKHSMKPKTEAEQTGQPDFEEDSSGSYEQTDSGPGSSENEEDYAGGGLAATEAFDADASGSEEDEEDGGEGESDDGSDLGIIDDEFDAGPGSASHAAKSGSGDEESSGDGADPVARAAVPAKFTEGEKGASFARAFAKIMQRKTPSGSAGVGAADEPGGTTVGKTAAAAANAAAEGPQARVVDVPILSGSRSLVKRRLEAQESAAERLASKRARLAVRLRGRAAVSRKGEDPAADAVEKGLQKLATRGVVMLFNAVAQAQRVSRDAAPNTRQSSQAMRQAVQAQLASAGPPLGAAAALKQPGGLGGTKGLLGLGKGPRGEGARGRLAAAAAGPGAPGWQVLQDSFTGLAGRSKMKDWDVAEGAGEEAEVGGQSDSEEGDAGW